MFLIPEILLAESFYIYWTIKDIIKFRIKEQKQYIRKQENKKSANGNYCLQMDQIFAFNLGKIITKPIPKLIVDFLEKIDRYKSYQFCLL